MAQTRPADVAAPSHRRVLLPPRMLSIVHLRCTLPSEPFLTPPISSGIVCLRTTMHYLTDVGGVHPSGSHSFGAMIVELWTVTASARRPSRCLRSLCNGREQTRIRTSIYARASRRLPSLGVQSSTAATCGRRARDFAACVCCEGVRRLVGRVVHLGRVVVTATERHVHELEDRLCFRVGGAFYRRCQIGIGTVVLTS